MARNVKNVMSNVINNVEVKLDSLLINTSKQACYQKYIKTVKDIRI